MKTIRRLLISIPILGMITLLTLLTLPNEVAAQEGKHLDVVKVSFSKIGWGKNSVTIKAKNLSNERQMLVVSINTSYLDSGRFYPIQNSVTFDFEPLQEKEISRDFYVIPDHGTLELRLLIAAVSKMHFYETVFYKKYQFRFEAASHEIHTLGFDKASYPSFEISKSKHFIFCYPPMTKQCSGIPNIEEWEKSYNDLGVELDNKLPERIQVFLLPDRSSAKSIMLFNEGRRLFYHNTMILITDKDYNPRQDLRAFLHAFPLLANQMDDFYVGTGGYGINDITNNELRFKVLLCLYQGLNPKAIAEKLDLPESQISEAADYLVNISNVRKEDGVYKPDILILTKDEIRRIVSEADQNAREVGELIEKNRGRVEDAYKQLSFSDVFPFKKIGFHFIGSLLLEEGMIDFFFRDRTLLLPYPHRPIKNDPEAAKLRYYCWMIEGREFDNDFYGYNDRGFLDKPQIVTYGQYFNLPRSFFDQTVKKLIEVSGGKEKFVNEFLPEYQKKLRNHQYVSSVPAIDGALKEFSYKIPVYNQKDFKVVRSFISELGPKILDYFKKTKRDLENIFRGLKGSQFSSFPEFFYMYYHLVFARATNYLGERGSFFVPYYRFDSWIQEEAILDIMNLKE